MNWKREVEQRKTDYTSVLRQRPNSILMLAARACGGQFSTFVPSNAGSLRSAINPKKILTREQARSSGLWNSAAVGIRCGTGKFLQEGPV